MVSHRVETRRANVRRIRPESRQPPSASDKTVSVEEGSLSGVDVLPKPDGFGTEASTTTQSFELVDEYTVPAGHVSRLRELSLSIGSNGEAKVSVTGTTYGPFTGPVDVTIPLDDSVLPPGYQVKVFHQSTDGNSTTTRATVVALEV